MRHCYVLLAALLLFGSAVLWPASTVRAEGLYGDEGKNVKSGDLNSQDYWWTKFDMMMLDMAIKQHQPQGRIGFQLASTGKRLDDLSKAYPNHEEIKEWKKKVEAIQAKIDPNASRSEYFKPGCPWEESNFAQLWVNLHWAKLLAEQKDYRAAFGLMHNVQQNYEIMMKADRMKDYPEELRKWVEENKPEADKFFKDLKEKTQR
jgi:hypothetical protein